MTNLYINYNLEDSNEVNYLTARLSETGHNVLRPDKELYKNNAKWDDLIQKHLENVDVIIVVWSRFSEKNKFSNYELRYLQGYASEKADSILFIPIVFDDVFIRFDMQNYVYLRSNRDDLEKLLFNLMNAIDTFLGRREALNRAKKEVQEKIEKTAADYIDETILELSNREKTLTKRANKWYISGYISIMLGIIVALLAAYYGLTNKDIFSNLYLSIFISLKSFIIIGLLLTLSKYSFVLGKSFMNESLINANRIHAISFGKFYLRAYGQQSKKEEIKDIFQHWNIDKVNGKEDSYQELDPELLKKISELIKIIKK